MIGRFLNWLLKHYSTSCENGEMCYVDSEGNVVEIGDILNHYSEEFISFKIYLDRDGIKVYKYVGDEVEVWDSQEFIYELINGKRELSDISPSRQKELIEKLRELAMFDNNV